MSPRLPVEGDGPLHDLAQAAAGVQVDGLSVLSCEFELLVEDVLLICLQLGRIRPFTVKTGLAELIGGSQVVGEKIQSGADVFAGVLDRIHGMDAEGGDDRFGMPLSQLQHRLHGVQILTDADQLGDPGILRFDHRAIGVLELFEMEVGIDQHTGINRRSVRSFRRIRA